MCRSRRRTRTITTTRWAAAGSTIPTDTSTVTLTLSSGTFVGGSTTVSVAAVAGVATFSTLAVANNGQYSLTASDGSLSPAISNLFAIGANAYVDFNIEATDFTAQFANNQMGVPGGTALVWNATAGVNDNTGGTPGGAVHVASGADQNAIFTPITFS